MYSYSWDDILETSLENNQWSEKAAINFYSHFGFEDRQWSDVHAIHTYILIYFVDKTETVMHETSSFSQVGSQCRHQNQVFEERHLVFTAGQTH